MFKVHDPTRQFEVHDPEMLAQAMAVLDACSSPQEMQEAVLAAVVRNEEWRGKQCLNLLAPEAPTSPMVRALLSAEVGTRAAEGHIGPVNRWFAGTKHIGMHETEMETIADFIARILIEQAAPEEVVDDVIAFRQPYQKLYYCFDFGMPA